MKTLYLLGAGASKSHANNEFPTINEIFSFGKRNNIINTTTRRIRNDYKEIKEYIYNLENKNILNVSEQINIEEIMTFLQIEKENNSNIAILLEEQLIYLILKVIDYCSENAFRNEKNNDYQIFVDMLKEQDTILTYNWDTVLDDYLGRKIIFEKRDENVITKRQYYNFFYKLTGIGHQTIEHVAIEAPHRFGQYDQQKGYYLKMHGSIDWLYCNNLNCRAYGEVFPVKEEQEKYLCSECSSVLKILMIPPVLNKTYNKFPIINSIWNKAKEEISGANKIVIWGYSFPPTDFYSKWLLEKNRNSIEEVDIINPSCVKTISKRRGIYRANNDYIKIVKSIYPKQKIKLYDKYSEYIRSNDIYDKYKIKKT